MAAQLQGNLQDDVALAKLLQEQERALWMLAGGGEAYYSSEYEVVDTENDSATAEADVSDEELARRLQAEEDQAAFRQLYNQQAVQVESAGEPVDTDQLQYEELQILGELAGTVSKGLHKQLLDKLPVFTYAGAIHATACVPDKCCICQLEYEPEDSVRLLPCKHCYHTNCVDQWLSNNKVCPVCNQEISAESFHT